eukprot:2860898-Prymnesium_polylepis.2
MCPRCTTSVCAPRCVKRWLATPGAPSWYPSTGSTCCQARDSSSSCVIGRPPARSATGCTACPPEHRTPPSTTGSGCPSPRAASSATAGSCWRCARVRTPTPCRARVRDEGRCPPYFRYVQQPPGLIGPPHPGAGPHRAAANGRVDRAALALRQPLRGHGRHAAPRGVGVDAPRAALGARAAHGDPAAVHGAGGDRALPRPLRDGLRLRKRRAAAVRLSATLPAAARRPPGGPLPAGALSRGASHSGEHCRDALLCALLALRQPRAGAPATARSLLRRAAAAATAREGRPSRGRGLDADADALVLRAVESLALRSDAAKVHPRLCLIG